jgi:hypothetical protein
MLKKVERWALRWAGVGPEGCEDDLKTTEIERRRRSSEALNRGGEFGEEVSANGIRRCPEAPSVRRQGVR